MYLWAQEPSSNKPHSQADWDVIPEEWKHYRWDAMDVLFICPFIVTPTYEFGLGRPYESGDSNVVKRYEWVVANARAQNPRLRIVAMHWFDNDPHGMGIGALKTDDQIDEFTDSVAAVLSASRDKTLVSDSGKTVSAQIDGYDVDVESYSMVEQLPKVLAKVRSKLDKASTSPRFTVSISPAWLDYLEGDDTLANSLDYLNMQRYDGGKYTTAEDYLAAIPGLKPHQLTFGISGEGTESLNAPQSNGDPPTLDSVIAAYKAGVDGSQYGGLWMWRLNSSNSIYENMLQVTFYNAVHNTTLPNTPQYAMVQEGWATAGGGNNKTAPWNTWDWQE